MIYDDDGFTHASSTVYSTTHYQLAAGAPLLLPALRPVLVSTLERDQHALRRAPPPATAHPTTGIPLPPTTSYVFYLYFDGSSKCRSSAYHVVETEVKPKTNFHTSVDELSELVATVVTSRSTKQTKSHIWE